MSVSVQCPFCFERVPIHLEAIRTTQTRRCPRGRSARDVRGATLQHCYCRAVSPPSGPAGPAGLVLECCKCGDRLKGKP